MIAARSPVTLELVRLTRFAPAIELFAAADARGSRQHIHQADFIALAPTEAEIRFALDWILAIPDPNHSLRAELRGFLKDIGHDDHAYYIA